MNTLEIEERISYLKSILNKVFYTPKQLVSLGIYGSKSTIYREAEQGLLQSAFITERRMIIFTDSLLERIELAMVEKGGSNETV
jgi:hypothetical protein